VRKRGRNWEQLTEQINWQAIAKNQANNKSQWQNQAIAIDMYCTHTHTHTRTHTYTLNKWSCFGLLKRSQSGKGWKGKGGWRELDTHPFRQTCDMLLPLFVSRSVEMSMQLSVSSSIVAAVTISVVCRMHHQFSVCPAGYSIAVKRGKGELCVSYWWVTGTENSNAISGPNTYNSKTEKGGEMSRGKRIQLG